MGYVYWRLSRSDGVGLRNGGQSLVVSAGNRGYWPDLPR